MPAKRKSAAAPVNKRKTKKVKLEPHEATFKATLLDELDKATKAIKKSKTIADIKRAQWELSYAEGRAVETLAEKDDEVKGTITVLACTSYMFYDDLGDDAVHDEDEANAFFWDIMDDQDEHGKQTPLVALAWWYDKDAPDPTCVKHMLRHSGGGAAILTGATLKDIQEKLFETIEDKGRADVVHIPKLVTLKTLKTRIADNGGDFKPDDGDDVLKLLSA